MQQPEEEEEEWAKSSLGGEEGERRGLELGGYIATRLLTSICIWGGFQRSP